MSAKPEAVRLYASSMMMRDAFANAALAGVLATYSNSRNPPPEEAADYAYRVADAMLARRQR